MKNKNYITKYLIIILPLLFSSGMGKACPQKRCLKLL